jgi:hypothetical protein
VLLLLLLLQSLGVSSAQGASSSQAHMRQLRHIQLLLLLL